MSNRVLHVLHGMHCGGIQTLLLALQKACLAYDIRFDYLLKSDGPDVLDENVLSMGGNVYHLPYKGWNRVLTQRALDDFFQSKQYKVAHFHYGFLRNCEPLEAARRNGVITRILHAHSGGADWRGIKERYFGLQHALNRVSKIALATDWFACSDAAADWFGFSRIPSSSDWQYVPNGIEIDRFSFDEQKRRDIRLDLGLDESNLCIGHIGRLTHLKNHRFLLNVFLQLLRYEPASKLLLVGDGELRESIEKEVEILQLQDAVILYGESESPEDLYNAMDVFAFPSLHEGLGMALVEAQANGLPAVVSNAIPAEAKVCENVVTVDLESGPELWAHELIKGAKRGRELKQLTAVRQAGYDIESVAFDLARFYQQKLG